MDPAEQNKRPPDNLRGPRSLLNTEWAGFEPTVQLLPYDGLANRCLQPLGHHSKPRANIITRAAH